VDTLADRPESGDQGERFAGENVHFSVRNMVANQRLYSEQFAALLAEDNRPGFLKATKLRPFAARSPGRLSADDSRHFSTLIGAVLGLVLMMSTGAGLWYATLGTMPKESPGNRVAVAGYDAAPTSSLAQSRRSLADENKESAQAATQLAPIATANLSSIGSPIQQALLSSGRLQAAIDAAPSRPSEAVILMAALPSDASAHFVGEFAPAPDPEVEVPAGSQTVSPPPQTHSTADDEPSHTPTSAKSGKSDRDKGEATDKSAYPVTIVGTSASITTASATIADPSAIADAKSQKVDSIADSNKDESSWGRKTGSASSDAERPDKRGKSSASSNSGSSKGNGPKGHSDKDQKGGKGNGGKDNGGKGNGKGSH